VSPVNWVNPLSPSTVVDKLKNVQQTKGELAQSQAETNALREENLRQNQVRDTPETEKVRTRDRRRERKERRHQEEEGCKNTRDSEAEEATRKRRRRIDVTV
jgi:hypothetical protein